jgi:putative tricarboxylic transport membrane protein
MEGLSHIVSGFAVVLQGANLFYLFIGCLAGTLIGVLPGIGPAAGIGLLLPITFGMDPTSALIMLAGMYYGAMYGGSTTAILINTPGEASSVMTALDGYQMAKQGRAGTALAIAGVSSFIAGSIGVLLLSVLATPLSNFALRFGPPEYFALMLFALSTVNSLTGGASAKGAIAVILGLMIATVGTDLQTGQARFTLGIGHLLEGVDFVLVVIGLFAIGEVLVSLEGFMRGNTQIMALKGRRWMTGQEFKESLPPMLRGGILGFFLGVLPGVGATVSSIAAYIAERKLSKNPEQFGKGAIAGVAGPEAANNSCTAGAMVPLLSLGIAGNSSTAVLMSAFIMFGIQPGPLLFQQRPEMVWGLINSMYLGNIMLLILNLPLVGLFVRLLHTPQGILFPLVLAVSAVGAYTANGNISDVWIAFGFGVLGYAFRKLGIPVAPLVLSLVLGKQLEQSFRQSMTMSDMSPVILFSSPISTSLMVMAFVSIALPLALRLRRRSTQALAGANS